MKTIREVFGFNLRMLRGDRTQAKMAEILGMPLRTYQRLEAAERMPQEATLEQITSKLGVTEASLFQSPVEYAPSPESDRHSLIARIVLALPNLDDSELLDLVTLAEGFPSARTVNSPSKLRRKAGQQD